MVYKWGIDGTSDQAHYKQKFVDDIENICENR